MQSRWHSVKELDTVRMSEMTRAVMVGHDGSIRLVVGNGSADGTFSMRTLLDRTPDFGLAAFLSAGESIGWPQDGFETWPDNLHGQTSSPITPGTYFGGLSPFTVREIWTVQDAYNETT